MKKIICLAFFLFCSAFCYTLVIANTNASANTNDSFKLIGYLDNSGWDNTRWLIDEQDVSKYDIVIIGFGKVSKVDESIQIEPPNYTKSVIATYKTQHSKNKVLLSWGGEHGRWPEFSANADMDKEINALSDQFVKIINGDPNIDGIDFDIEGCYPFKRTGEGDPRLYEDRFAKFIQQIRNKVKNRIILITIAPQPIYYDEHNTHLVIPMADEFHFDDIIMSFDYVLLQFYNLGWDKKFKDIENEPGKIGELFQILKNSHSLSQLTKEQLIIGKPVAQNAATSGFNEPEKIDVSELSQDSSGIMGWDIYRDKLTGFKFVNTLYNKIHGKLDKTKIDSSNNTKQ